MIKRIITLLLFIGQAWGQDCTANDGTDGVELWGECYSIENTTWLDLSYMEMTGEISPEIGNLINLDSLILKENQFSGIIPPEISSLTNLNVLDLAGNQLTGVIPPEIGELESLTFIHLEYNQFTGPIPPEISDLSNLVWLNFVHNQLTGEIPESICDLNMNWSDPNNFNISENQLCPPYPDCIEESVGYQDTSGCDQVSMDEIFLRIWDGEYEDTQVFMLKHRFLLH